MPEMWTIETYYKKFGWLRASNEVYTDPLKVNRHFNVLKNQGHSIRIMGYKRWCFDEPVSISIRPIEEN